MNLKTELKLAATRKGRIAIHAMAFAMDHKFTWHAKGIWHELMLQGQANPFHA